MVSMRAIAFKPSRNECMVYVLLAFGSLFAGLYLELFFESCGYLPGGGILEGDYSPVRALFILAISALTFFLSNLFVRINNSLIGWFVRYRYVVGIVLVAVFVIADVNLSSISIWAYKLGEPDKAGLLFGQVRWIRSDEYAVSTLWYISQSSCDWSAISSSLVGGGVDTRLIYNCPSWSLVTLFRPSLWGFLLFGASRGLAWKSILRIVFTFLASFDLFKLFSRKNGPSLIFAMLITFSPALPWWEYWDGIPFGSYLVVCFDTLVNRDSKAKPLVAILIPWLCGCYLMTLYPAWMVPFFYVFALMGVVLVVKKRKEGTLGIGKLNVLILVGALLSLSIAVVLIFTSSFEAYTATSNTVYPGTRFETGGGALSLLAGGGYSVFFAIEQPSFANAPELSSFISFFPFGTACFVLSQIWNKQKLYLPLVALQIFMVLFIAVGVPGIFAKFSLFSMVPASRCTLACGYLEIFLLVLAVVCVGDDGGLSVRLGRRNSILLIAALISFVFAFEAYLTSGGNIRRLFLVMSFLLAFVFVSSLLYSATKGDYKVAVVCSLLVVGLIGCCVYPIHHGIEAVTDTELAKEVQQLVQDDPEGKWVVEDSGIGGLSNYVAAQGAKTLTSTQAYPVMEFWNLLDGDHSNEDVYNRYSHVSVKLGGDSTEFSLIADDHVLVNLPFNELKTLNANYLISSNDYDGVDTGEVVLTKLANANGMNIYLVSQALAE